MLMLIGNNKVLSALIQMYTIIKGMVLCISEQTDEDIILTKYTRKRKVSKRISINALRKRNAERKKEEFNRKNKTFKIEKKKCENVLKATSEILNLQSQNVNLSFEDIFGTVQPKLFSRSRRFFYFSADVLVRVEKILGM